MKENGNRPAFPSSNEVKIGAYSTFGHVGLTKREWFAGMAMQTLVMLHDCAGGVSYTQIMQSAYRYADAMIQEGEKE